MQQKFRLESLVDKARVKNFLDGLNFGSLGKALRYTVTVKEVRSTRSLEQNAKLWAMLGDISKQKEFSGKLRSAEDWKDLLTAALHQEKNEQVVVPGLNGGFLVLGLHTKNLTIAEMGELIEFMCAWGAENDIDWSKE